MAGALCCYFEVLKAEEERKREIKARLDAVLAAAGAVSLDAARIKREVRDLAGDVTGLLQTHRTPQTRAMLRKLFVGPIVGEPIVVDGR